MFTVKMHHNLCPTHSVWNQLSLLTLSPNECQKQTQNLCHLSSLKLHWKSHNEFSEKCSFLKLQCQKTVSLAFPEIAKQAQVLMIFPFLRFCTGIVLITVKMAFATGGTLFFLSSWGMFCLPLLDQWLPPFLCLLFCQISCLFALVCTTHWTHACQKHAEGHFKHTTLPITFFHFLCWSIAKNLSSLIHCKETQVQKVLQNCCAHWFHAWICLIFATAEVFQQNKAGRKSDASRVHCERCLSHIFGAILMRCKNKMSQSILDCMLCCFDCHTCLAFFLLVFTRNTWQQFASKVIQDSLLATEAPLLGQPSRHLQLAFQNLQIKCQIVKHSFARFIWSVVSLHSQFDGNNDWEPSKGFWQWNISWKSPLHCKEHLFACSTKTMSRSGCTAQNKIKSLQSNQDCLSGWIKKRRVNAWIACKIVSMDFLVKVFHQWIKNIKKLLLWLQKNDQWSVQLECDGKVEDLLAMMPFHFSFCHDVFEIFLVVPTHQTNKNEDSWMTAQVFHLIASEQKIVWNNDKCLTMAFVSCKLCCNIKFLPTDLVMMKKDVNNKRNEKEWTARNWSGVSQTNNLCERKTKTDSLIFIFLGLCIIRNQNHE